jgi:alkylation response protein AidB-like acyl-CoA dehydrogenase
MLNPSVVRGIDVIFAFSAEQDELRKSVRKFLEDKSPENEVRRLMESVDGYDPAVWTQLCEQLGLAGLVIPEKYGGSGFSYVELIVVFEEMGRALLCAPYFSTVALAANLLMAVDDESAKVDYLPSLASGVKIGTVALAETTGRWDEAGVTTAATKSANGWLLNGEKCFVTDGHVADVVFVAARTPAGVSIFAVDQGATGFVASALATLDQTRKQAKLTLAQTPARLIGDEGTGWPALSKMLDLAAVALAAEQVGGAQQILDVTVQYAKDREQFGQPIGSFQVIKHKCADMLLEVESARSAAYYAGWVAADDDEDLPIAASLAKSYCSEAYFHAVAESIQIHGGIGFTWEHPIHLYFKRAKSSELLFGDVPYHRELLAQRVGI